MTLGKHEHSKRIRPNEHSSFLENSFTFCLLISIGIFSCAYSLMYHCINHCSSIVEEGEM